jgi:hypothetical protein
MNSFPLGTSIQHYSERLTTSQALETAGPQAGAQHAQTLYLALMSHNTITAFEYTNEGHALLAMLAIAAIGDTSLSLQSAQGPEAIYATASGDLRVHARLNESSRYDVTSIDAPNVAPLYLPAAPLSLHTPAQTSLASRYMAQQSQGALTLARMTLTDRQAFEGPPELSGSLTGPHHGPARASIPVPGPSRKLPGHAQRKAPYSSCPLPAGFDGKPPQRKSPSDTEMAKHMRDSNGLLRTQKGFAQALHDHGFKANKKLIGKLLQGAGARRRFESATNDQIGAQLLKEDNSLRTTDEILAELNANKLGADPDRVAALLQGFTGEQKRKNASEDQISLYLYKNGNSLRTEEEVRSALHANGLRAGSKRILAQLKAARSQP